MEERMTVIIKNDRETREINPIRCGVHDNLHEQHLESKAYRLFLKLDYEEYKVFSSFCGIKEEIVNPYILYAIEGEYFPQEKRAWIKEIHGYVECETGSIDYYEDLCCGGYYLSMEII